MKKSKQKFLPPVIRHIAVVAPGGPIPEKQLDKNLALLRRTDVKITVMPNVICEHNDMPFLAAPDELRAADIMNCLQDNSVDMVMAVRGGYGCLRILPLIDWKLLRRRPLIFCGFSDITALLLAMYKHNVFIPVAAPMATHIEQLLADEFSLSAYETAIFAAHNSIKQGNKYLHISIPTHMEMKVFKKGLAKASVLPVNLSVFISMIGTPFFPDVSSHILLLEDVNEPLYKIDRMLTQLILSGIIERSAGVIFGKFINCGEKEHLYKIFMRIAQYVKGPVIAEFPFGHDFPFYSLPVGAIIELKI